MDIPLSPAAKRSLAYAADESEKLRHSRIGTEYLLLGLLREESSLAHEILSKYGLTYALVLEKLLELTNKATPNEIQQLLKLSEDMRSLATMMLMKCDAVDLLCQQLTNANDKSTDK